jgi:O-antigen/teichoic acid export membrane protein
MVMALLAAAGLVLVGPVLVHLAYGPRFVASRAVFATSALSAALVSCLGYTLWAAAALDRRRAVTVAVVASTAVELVLVLLWHTGPAVLGLEPGLGVVTGAVAGVVATRLVGAAGILRSAR